MDKYITIKPWETNAPNHLELHINELVEVAQNQPDKPEWKDWVWCQNATSSGWVPKHVVQIIGEGNGKVLENYSAKELRIGAGEVVIGYQKYFGWIWSQNEATSELGWLPQEILLKLS